MKKKMKGIIGLCLVAALALGGVGRYAQAQTYNGFNYDEAYGGCDAYKSCGSAYTTVRSGYAIYGTVSATFWCVSDGVEVFRRGNGAAGEHGGSVVLNYPGDVDVVTAAYTTATHTVTCDAEGGYTEYTSDDWRK